MSDLSMDTKKTEVKKAELPSLGEVGKRVGEFALGVFKGMTRSLVMPPHGLKASEKKVSIGADGSVSQSLTEYFKEHPPKPNVSGSESLEGMQVKLGNIHDDRQKILENAKKLGIFGGLGENEAKPNSESNPAKNARLGNIFEDKGEILENAKKLEIFGGNKKIEAEPSRDSKKVDYESFAKEAARSAAKAVADGAVDSAKKQILEQAKKHPAFNMEEPKKD